MNGFGKLNGVDSESHSDIDDISKHIQDVDGLTPAQIRDLIESTTKYEVSYPDKENGSLQADRSQHSSREQPYSVKVTPVSVQKLWSNGIHLEIQNERQRKAATAIGVAVESFMDRLVEAIGTEDVGLRGRVLPVGSAFEEARHDRPEEFDFNVVLVNLSEKCEVVATPANEQHPSGFTFCGAKSAAHCTTNHHRVTESSSTTRTAR